MLNSSYYDHIFDEHSKAQAFDRIAECFYNHNFTTCSKSEIDILMFSIFKDRIDQYNSENQQKIPSDAYALAKQLGITPSRINTLRTKKSLKYPQPEHNWKKELLSLLANAQISNDRIQLYIEDPALLMEVRHTVEERGSFVDFSFNKNLLLLMPASFLDLLILTCNEQEKKAIVSDVKETLKKNNHAVNELTPKESLASQFKKAKIDIPIALLTQILSSFIPLINEPIKSAILPLVDKFII